MVQMNKLRIAMSAFCLLATISSAFACTVTPGGFRFLVFQSETNAWNIDLGVTYFEEPKSLKITVESKDSAGTFAAAYFLTVKGPTGLRNDDLTLHWLDTDGADFVIGNGGSQAFLGVGTLNWNSAPVEFPATHKNKITLTLTFKPTAPKGTYNGKMWVTFTQKPIEAKVAITPTVLNVKSKGEWVTAYISLSGPYKEEDIDISSVKLWYKNSFVQAEWGKATKQFLMVKFSGDEVIKMLGKDRGILKLTVKGLVNGIEFSGTDTITVIKP
jgi:hypothetical protein